MTKLNLKDLVMQIKKVAQEAPPPPTGAILEPSGTPVKPSHHYTGASSNTDIMTMQHAIQDLAINLSSKDDPFLSFLNKNYMQNGTVMNTMHAIVNMNKGERFVNGHWNKMTSAAIKDTFVFATNLFSFINDVNRFATKKMQVAYTQDDLTNLENYTKGDDLTQEQKVEAATSIAKNVKLISAMYSNVRRQILQTPQYQQFLEKTAPIKTNEGATKQQLDDITKAFPRGIRLSFPDFTTIIYPADLVSIDSLKKWMVRAAPQLTQSRKLTPEMVINEVEKASTEQPAEQPNEPAKQPEKDWGF